MKIHLCVDVSDRQVEGVNESPRVITRNIWGRDGRGMGGVGVDVETELPGTPDAKHASALRDTPGHDDRSSSEVKCRAISMPLNPLNLPDGGQSSPFDL